LGRGEGADIVKIVRSAWLFTVVLAALGYVGAGLFYGGPLLGFTQEQFACPICPHVDGLGDPLSNFVRRTLGGGTLNALSLVTVGWFFRGVISLGKRLGTQSEFFG